MSWRDELLDSKGQVLDFIDRHLSAAELPPFFTEDLDEPNRFAPCVWTKEPDGTIDYEKQPILFFDAIDENRDRCLIDGFVIGDDFKGRKLGLVAAKAMIAVAYEYSVPTISLPLVDRDGPSFWPFLGAIPYEPPITLSDQISAVFQDRSFLISVTDAQNLINIQKIAEQNPYLGWRKLGTSDVARPIRHKILSQICYDKSLRLIPAEPTTSAILRSQLGILPPFRSPNARTDYRYVLSSLSGDSSSHNNKFQP